MQRLACPRVPGSSSSSSSQAHLTASARFRVRAPRPGIRPVIPRPPAGGLVITPRFPAAFRPPAFASRSSFPAGELGPPHGRLTGQDGRTPTGFPRSARTSCDRVGRPLNPGDNGAHPDRGDYRPGARRFAAASPCTPPHFPSTGVCITRHHRGFTQFARPVFPSPVAARMERAALGLYPRASHPADQEPDDARQGGDRPSSTDLELHAQLTSVDLQSGSSLVVCDLGSHVAVALVRSCAFGTIALEKCARHAAGLVLRTGRSVLARVEQASAPPSAEKQSPRTDRSRRLAAGDTASRATGEMRDARRLWCRDLRSCWRACAGRACAVIHVSPSSAKGAANSSAYSLGRSGRHHGPTSGGRVVPGDPLPPVRGCGVLRASTGARGVDSRTGPRRETRRGSFAFARRSRRRQDPHHHSPDRAPARKREGAARRDPRGHILGAMWPVASSRSTWAVVLVAAAAGLAAPALPTAMRLQWRQLLGREDARLPRAYAFESLAQVSLFVLGPLVAAAGIAALGAGATLAATGGLLLVGALPFAALAVEDRAQRPAHRRARASPVRIAGVRTLVIATVIADAALRVIDVAVIAFAKHHGNPARRGCCWRSSAWRR